MGCFCLHNHVNQFFIISLLQSCDSILLENPDYKEVNPSDSVKPPLTSWLEFMRDSQLEAPSWTVPKFLMYRNGVGFPGGSDGKEPACNSGDLVWSLCQEDSLENRMATHSSILAWRIPWIEDPKRLKSMGHKILRDYHFHLQYTVIIVSADNFRGNLLYSNKQLV